MVQELLVRCRGLPFACTESQLREWIGDKDIQSVTLPMGRDGRPSGEGFIVFTSQEGYDNALKKDRENMGSRYVEVFPGTPQDKDIVERASKAGGWGVSARRAQNFTAPDTLPSGEYVVRLRGLPFGAEAKEIVNFFSPLPITTEGIAFPSNRSGPRGAGEAYAAFKDRETAEEALKYDHKNIQHRYIEVFKSTQDEMSAAVGGYPDEDSYDTGYDTGYGYDRAPAYGGDYRRGGEDPWAAYARGSGYDQYGGGAAAGAFAPQQGNYENWRGQAPAGGGGGNRRFVLKMRGIPFRATEAEIYDFFGLNRPTNVEILFESNGRAAGEARVEFGSRSAYDEALRKDKEYMGSRYVELFPDTPGHY
ncbi:unnamed protein product, partial [Mesorhabditis spiculigera]